MHGQETSRAVDVVRYERNNDNDNKNKIKMEIGRTTDVYHDQTDES